MTKTDWTILFIRLVGLYMIATHLAIFIAGVSTLVVLASRAGSINKVDPMLFQSPTVAALALGVGLLLVFKARVVGAMLEKHDKAPK